LAQPQRSSGALRPGRRHLSRRSRALGNARPVGRRYDRSAQLGRSARTSLQRSVVMKALAVTIGWMVRDTFRQSLASGIFWVLLTISIVSTLVCASASIVGDAQLAAPDEQAEFLNPNDPDAKDPKRAADDGVAVISGELKLGFGALSVPLARDARGAVHTLE